MRDDARVLVWGEDVRIGVMGPTRGLVEEFGPDRVLDCPISEAGFVGAAIGAAAGGLRPVVDIMFSSFTYVAFDQLANQAGRLRYMTGGQVAIPLVIVGSAGAAGANAAQHSEVPSALFLQAGGLRLVFPSTPHQAFWLMQAAIQSDDPVVVLHHPALAATRGSVNAHPLSLGDAVVEPEGRDVSVLAVGLMAHRARAVAKALAGEGVSVEVVDVCSLSPMPWDTMVASVQKTGRAVVVDEGRLTCSVASELAAGLGERAFNFLRAPVRRLGVPDVPIPFAPSLEAAVVPSEEAIAAAVREAARA
jgi:pyruvate dehydrogenase E1 component beta subunit